MSGASSEIVIWITVFAALGLAWLVGWHVLRKRSLNRRSSQDPKPLADGPVDALTDESEESSDLQSSMAALPDAVMLVGAQLQLKWANDTARKWFDIDVDTQLEQPLSKIVKVPGFMEYLSKRNYSESLECAAPGDPSVLIGIRIVPYRGGQFLLQGRDITKIHQLEQIRRDFVSNASHELRTPLSILYGYLEIMQDESDDNISEQWKPAVRQMFEQTHRIKQIIDDMMLLSRLDDVDESLEQHFTTLAPVIHKACDDAEALGARKGHTVIRDIDENYSLLCNLEEIQSLVMNLVSNAVHYTPDEGKITIKWKVDLIGGCLSVRDTGIGIEQENIPRITERFYRTDPARSRAAGGTGLGLAIVNHIVSRHNARLIIRSKVGKGSEFKVHFPQEMIYADHAQVNLLLK